MVLSYHKFMDMNAHQSSEKCFMLAEGPGPLSRPPLDVGKRVLMRGGC